MRDTDWGQVSFKARKKVKGLGLGQQEKGGLHSLTWWGFWSDLPPHGCLSDCVSFSSARLKSAGRKVTPSWSQQVRRSNGGWPAAIANVHTFVSFFVYTKSNRRESKAIGPVPGHLKKFWWYTPRIPGISRVFQSYTVWDLGTPRSREKQIRTTPSPGTETEKERHVFNTAENHDRRERVPLQSLKIRAHNKCLSWNKPDQYDLHQDIKINQLFLETTKLIYNYLYATTAGQPLMISRLHLIANELLWVVSPLVQRNSSKMRNEKRFPEKLNFPVTRTRHIPVIAYIIACSAEDLLYTTTKSDRQYIFIQLSIPAMKKNM